MGEKYIITSNWKYCVAGNIKKIHFDENNTIRYGTSAFTGGTKVYLCGKTWDKTSSTITVIGLNRGGKKFQIHDISPDMIENVRCCTVHIPAVIDVMNNYEFGHLWWDNTYDDKVSAEDFAEQWQEIISSDIKNNKEDNIAVNEEKYLGELLKATAEENQTRKILAILNECTDLAEAKEKIKALLK